MLSAAPSRINRPDSRTCLRPRGRDMVGSIRLGCQADPGVGRNLNDDDGEMGRASDARTTTLHLPTGAPGKLPGPRWHTSRPALTTGRSLTDQTHRLRINPKQFLNGG
jgi:hypothetical protein